MMQLEGTADFWLRATATTAAIGLACWVVLQRWFRSDETSEGNDSKLAGSWHPWYSTKPLREAMQLSANYSACVCQKVKENGRVSKIHPGIRVILIADHRAASTVLGADDFDREPHRRFTSAAVHPSIVGKAFPALATNGDIGHPAARALTLAIMHQRMGGLQEAIDASMEALHNAECRDQELLPTILHLTASIVFRWIFGEAPLKDDVVWFLRTIVKELNVDTLGAWMMMRRSKFDDDDNVILDRLLQIVTTSRYWESYCNLATSAGTREALSGDRKAMAQHLLFTFMLGSFGVGLCLHPSIAMISMNPDTVTSLLAEMRKNRAIGLCSSPSTHPQLQAVSLELIRLFPAPTHFCRVAKRDMTLSTSTGETFRVSRGTKVMVSAAHVHYDETVFGEDANTFNPQRFQKDPALIKKLFLFGISHEAKSGSASMCPASGSVEDLPRVNPYGCAAAEAGFGLPLFKTILGCLLMDFKWTLDQRPVCCDPRYFGFVGPINLKLATLSSRSEADMSTNFVPDGASPIDKIHSEDLEESFKAACSLAVANVSTIGRDSGTILYGLYKQAMFGDAPETGPSFTRIVERNKWAVWRACKGHSQEQAKAEHVSIIKKEVLPKGENGEPMSNERTATTANRKRTEDQMKDEDIECYLQGNTANSSSTVQMMIIVRSKPFLKAHAGVKFCPHQREAFDNFLGVCSMDKLRLEISFPIAGKGSGCIVMEKGLGSRLMNGKAASSHVSIPQSWLSDSKSILAIKGALSCQSGAPLSLPGMSQCIVAVELAAPALSFSRFFPFQDWIGSNGTFLAFDDSVTVSDLVGELKDHAEADVRERRLLWGWQNKEGLPCSTFRAICQIPDTYERVLYAPLLPSLGFASTETTANSIEDFKRLIVDSGRPLPLLLSANFLENKNMSWASDKVFTELALGGSHPHHLRVLRQTDARPCLLLKHAPNRCLDANETIYSSLQKGHFFVLSYDILEGLKTNGDNWLPAPICIFYWSDEGKCLSPVVIQIDHPNAKSAFAGEVAIVPENADLEDADFDANSDPLFWKWTIAKASVRAADTNYFQIVPHYLFSHLVPEIVVVGANRALPSGHPLLLEHK